MTKVNTNTRPIKRVEEGFTVIGSEKDRNKSICEFCSGRDTCSILYNANRYAEHAKLQIVTCKSFVSPIPFTDPTGLDQAIFNTVRLGEAWFNRLKYGDYVSLTGNDKTSIGFKMVQSVHTGPAKEMLQEHAKLNHLILGDRESTQTDVSNNEKVSRLTNVLKKQYGPHIFNESKPLTVIYLGGLL